MGYIRFDATWFGLQLGRERVRWNENYGSSLFLSNNAPTFDFIRLDASYGVVNYNFIHGWLLGPHQRIEFDPDQSLLPYYDPKYFVAHRIEFSLFRNRLQIGANELVVYSRESPELGYLNPVSFLISTERVLGERDKVMMSLDFAVRPVRNFEIKTGIFFDDIHHDKSFTSYWRNQWAVYGGFYWVDPLGLPNLDLFVDYTRIEPYVYSHNRSPNLYYANDEFGMGHPFGPNSDDTILRLVYKPQWQWRFELEFQRKRHGDNERDEEGNVIRNVGGNLLEPFRRGDNPEKQFLDGIPTENFYYRASVRYEIFKQIVIGGRVEWANLSTGDESWNNVTVSVGIWVDY